MTARITGLWLTAFKSFHDVVIPLSPLSVLIGRNGSGKSNALDGLDVLHRLATIGDVRDALEGTRRDSAPVRGGIEGCAPFGSDSFELGVRMARETGEYIDLDVRVQVRPDVQVVWERLRSGGPGSSPRVSRLPRSSSRVCWAARTRSSHCWERRASATLPWRGR